mmetsp:Transcript_50102/g.57653  ORF Transcript_50102/g.57653 Transcript_50102/m.57653 type:complete len:88 (+) Transcript_50102:76-339(+)
MVEGAANFDLACEEIKTKKDLSNDQKLALYGTYKQATVGDVNTDRPGIFDQTGRAKWDAWNSKKGTDKEKAKADYVALVETALGRKL